MFIRKIALGIASLFLGSAAFAVPVTFDFTGGGNTLHNSLTFSGSGVDVTASGWLAQVKPPQWRSWCSFAR